MKNPSFPSDASRRHFLGLGAKMAASASLLGTIGGFQRAMAANATTTGYRALVCVYLNGGNNGFNTVVPITSAGYNTYANSRRNLALPQNSLLAMNGTASDGYTYGMNSNCTELRSLFNAGRAAVICNVGTLVQPTSLTQAQSGTVPLPLQLFSHVDQSRSWWTSVPDRASATGWAGRIADLYSAQGYVPRVAMNINVGGANYWQDSALVQPYVLGTNGAPQLFNAINGYRNNSRQTALRDMLRAASTDPNLLVAEYASIQNSALSKVDVVNSALSAAGDLATPFPTYNGDTSLGAQLHEVARVIKAHSQLGETRQIFFVNINGFDTHATEIATQASLLNIVSKNINSFYNAMVEIGEQNNVTLFTASDFGRGLTSNGDGSDHAWGNHQFVVGGAVRGGYYGAMPSLAVGGANDVGNGRIIPTTSTDQYAATLARWYGVPDTSLNTVFPNLGNFTTRNLGFLG